MGVCRSPWRGQGEESFPVAVQVQMIALPSVQQRRRKRKSIPASVIPLIWHITIELFGQRPTEEQRNFPLSPSHCRRRRWWPQPKQRLLLLVTLFDCRRPLIYGPFACIAIGCPVVEPQLFLCGTRGTGSTTISTAPLCSLSGH